MNKYKLFVLEQVMEIFNSGEFSKNTKTIQLAFLAIWSCGRPSDSVHLENFIKIITKPDWQFTDWSELALLLQNS